MTVYLTLDHYPAGDRRFANTSQGPDVSEQMTEDLCQDAPQSAFISFRESKPETATRRWRSRPSPSHTGLLTDGRERGRGCAGGLRTPDVGDGTRLIDLADTAIPGLKDAVRYVEVGTPLIK